MNGKREADDEGEQQRVAKKRSADTYAVFGFFVSGESSYGGLVFLSETRLTPVDFDQLAKLGEALSLVEEVSILPPDQWLRGVPESVLELCGRIIEPLDTGTNWAETGMGGVFSIVDLEHMKEVFQSDELDAPLALATLCRQDRRVTWTANNSGVGPYIVLSEFNTFDSNSGSVVFARHNQTATELYADILEFQKARDSGVVKVHPTATSFRLCEHLPRVTAEEIDCFMELQDHLSLASGLDIDTHELMHSVEQYDDSKLHQVQIAFRKAQAGDDDARTAQIVLEATSLLFDVQDEQ